MADSAVPTGAACEVLRYWATYAGQPPDSVPFRETFAQLSEHTAVEKQLSSIFHRLGKSDITYVKPAALKVTGDTIFPTSAQAGGITEQREKIQQEASAIIATFPDQQQQLTALADLLEREAWCLPSPLAGIPLYDFARVHAGLAAAQAHGKATLEEAQAHGGATLLVGGDVSGVQDFIYTIPAKGAAKQLRGRSLYLQLLAEAIARYILGEVGMPDVCLLYCGGGRFYAVLPASAQKGLNDLKEKIALVLLVRHGVAPYLALGWQPLEGKETSYSKLWENLHEQINQAKQRKFADLTETQLKDLLFNPREQHKPELVVEEARTDTFGESIAKMGQQVGKSLYLRDREETPPDLPENERTPEEWYDVLKSFSRGIRALNQENISDYGKPSRLRAMRDLAPEEEKAALDAMRKPCTLGRRYTVNEVPLVTASDLAQASDEQAYIPGDEPREGEPKPFGMLAAQSQGIKRLGVLRMDVDDLGALFGRAKSERSIADLAETAALSAALGRFFEGYVGTLCRNINEEISRKEQPDGGIYTVYSGGDDLFIVGSWHLLPDLAYRIRQDFARYVTGKTSEGGAYIASTITLSGGITLHTGKFPIYQAADMAHEALEAAKAFTRPNGTKKDALTFLGITIGWEEYAEVKQLQQQLFNLVEQGAPAALLITLQSLAQQARPKRFNRDGRPQATHGPWMWRGAYMLTRLAERVSKREGGEKSKKEIEDLIHYIRNPLKEHAVNQPIILAGMAARWAQLLRRGEDKRQGEKHVR